MKCPVIFQNAKMDSWHLIDRLIGDFAVSPSVLCETHRGRRMWMKKHFHDPSTFALMESGILHSG